MIDVGGGVKLAPQAGIRVKGWVKGAAWESDKGVKASKERIEEFMGADYASLGKWNEEAGWWEYATFG